MRTLPEHTRAFSLATIMVKRSPFTAGELESLATWADDLLFDLPYLPPAADRPGTMKVFRTFLGPDEEAAAFVKSRRYDLSPTTDDKPFFFDRVPLAAWLGKRLGLDMPKYAEGRIPLGSRTLLAAFCVTGVGTLVLIFLPFFLRPKDAVKVEVALPLARRITWVSYFACLGLGYIVVEIVLIQRFNLYLGNPSYALTVALFTMLASSGLGALVAGRWSHRGALVPMLSCVCAGIAVVMAGLDPLIDATLGSPASSRILFAVAFVAPIGFVMGMPFPSGLRQAGLDSESLVSWAWAVNGGASVFGSVSAVVVSMTVGFSASLMLALFAYLVALALTTRLGSDPSGSGVGSG